MKKEIIIISLIVYLLLVSCKSENYVTNSFENYVKVRIDFQSGFAGHWVMLRDIEEIIYTASFSTMSSLGYQSLFETYLKKGDNRLYLARENLYDTNISKHLDTLNIQLGGEIKYYLILNIVADTLHYQVQKNPFMYQ